MSKASFALIVSLVLGVTACAKDTGLRPPSFVSPAKAKGISFVERTFVRKDPQCSIRDACASLRLAWPQPSTGPRAARASVAAAIDDFLLARVPGEGRASSVDELAGHFIDAFHAFRAANPDSPQIWTVSRSVRLVDASREVVSLAFDAAEFTGGAVPQSTRHLATFDAETGRRYALEDLVPADRLEELRRLAEKRFREARGLAPGTDLRTAGFRFEGGRFRLTDNFAVLGGGLLFHWNSNEVAPLAKGPTEITLTRSEIKRIAGDGR